MKRNKLNKHEKQCFIAYTFIFYILMLIMYSVDRTEKKYLK